MRGARAESSQADRITLEANGDFSLRLRFERDVAAEPGGNILLARLLALSLVRELASEGLQVCG